MISFTCINICWKLSSVKGSVENVKVRKNNLKTTRINGCLGLSRPGCILSINLPKLFGNRCT